LSCMGGGCTRKEYLPPLKIGTGLSF
jgi:hypothetical protein